MNVSKSVQKTLNSSVKRPLKWGLRLVILLVVLLIAAALLFDTVVTSLAESRIREATGLDVKIGKLEIGLIHPILTLENFKVYNTAEFGGALLIDLPELHLEYDRDDWNAGRVHLKLVRLNLAELHLVKSQAGRTNFMELFTKLEATELRKARQTKVVFAGVDTLNLTLGKVIRTDLGQSSPPLEYDFRVKNQIYTDLKTEQDVQTKLLPVIVRAGVAYLTQGLFNPPRAPLKPATGSGEQSDGKTLEAIQAPLEE